VLRLHLLRIRARLIEFTLCYSQTLTNYVEIAPKSLQRLVVLVETFSKLVLCRDQCGLGLFDLFLCRLQVIDQVSQKTQDNQKSKETVAGCRFGCHADNCRSGGGLRLLNRLSIRKTIHTIRSFLCAPPFSGAARRFCPA